MHVSKLLSSSLTFSMQQNAAVHSQWVSAGSKLGPVSPVVLQGLLNCGQLDCLLRQLEDEERQGSSQTEDHLDIYYLSLFISLSEAWLFQVYEVLRTTRDLLREKEERLTPSQAELFRRIELIRMPLAKGEIAKASRSADYALGILGSSETHKYRRGHFKIPREICGTTGSVIWIVPDKSNMTTRQLSRRKLSDLVLREFL